MDVPSTPVARSKGEKQDKRKRFMRKPDLQKSQASSSKNSFSSCKETYIKSPASLKSPTEKNTDFFSLLALSISNRVPETQVRKSVEPTDNQYKLRKSQRFAREDKKLRIRINTIHSKIEPIFQKCSCQDSIAALAQLNIKNHEISIISDELQRYRCSFQFEKQKRIKMEEQKKKLMQQLKQSSKMCDSLNKQQRKLTKEKDQLVKQISLLQRGSIDEKTRSLQSYREQFLEGELQKAKKYNQAAKTQIQKQLEAQIRVLFDGKSNAQSRINAMKLQIQCLMKQLASTQQMLKQRIISSDQYQKLRNKYTRLLQQFSALKSQNCSLKAKLLNSQKNGTGDSSDIFNITASEIDEQLSSFKEELPLCGIGNSNLRLHRQSSMACLRK